MHGVVEPAAATMAVEVGVGVGVGAGAAGLLIVTLPPVPGEATSPAPQPVKTSALAPSRSMPWNFVTFSPLEVDSGIRFVPGGPALGEGGDSLTAGL